MSYYPNPYLAQLAQIEQQRRQQSNPSPYGQGYHQPQHPFATPQFNFYAPSSPSPAAHDDFDEYPSIDEEERAAIAHLRAIQRRKQLEQINRLEIEREATLARQYREREIALAQAQREREVALAQALRQREADLAYAKAERERELALARRAREVELARFAEIQNQRRQAIASAHERQQAINEKRQHAINEHRRRQCTRQCARRVQEAPASAPAPAPAPSAQASTESQADTEAFNKWIGSLFGLQLPADVASAVKKDTPAPTPAPVEKPVPAAESVPIAKPIESAPTPAAAEEKKAEFPEAINDLLSSFLGLRVEPDSKLGEAVSNQVNKVPEGLNEFLNQFGLEFFPDQSEEKTEKKEEAGSSASPSTPTPTPAPAASTSTSTQAQAQSTPSASQSRGPVDLAEYLSGSHGLPPFVRDILGNVELAFKERSQEEKKPEGKGKGVAEGEKKAVPTPAPSAAPTTAPAPTPAPTAPSAPEVPQPENDSTTAISESLSQLAQIESELAEAKSQFTFPQALSFGPQTSDSSPSLLFNRTNKPYHAQNNRLLQLLLQADGVASNGDREVRRRRKEVVKAVEGEIEKMERKRDEYWAEVKERRETTGEISENESWTTGSSFDHEEVVHVEDVAEETTVESNKPLAETTTAEAGVGKSEPATFAEAVKTTPDDTSSETKVDEKKESEVQDKEKKDDKEEGYELL
jgi:hypothetical protein